MKNITGQILWAASGAILVAAVLAGLAYLVNRSLEPAEAEVLASWLGRNGGPFYMVVAALVGGGAWLFHGFHGNYPGPIRKLAAEIDLMVRSGQGRTLPKNGGSAMETLGKSLDGLVEAQNQLKAETEATVAKATATMERERNRLAALMAELEQAVIACNLEGGILLYNQRAKALFQKANGDKGGSGLIGLGRSVFGLLPRDVVIHAMMRLQDHLAQRADSGEVVPQTINITVPMPDGRLVRLRVAPVLEDNPPMMAGLVLLLEDDSATVLTSQRRYRLLHKMTETSRSGLANIRAAVENLLSFPDMDAEHQARFIQVIGDEAKSLGERIDGALGEYADSLRTQWPLEDLRATDLQTVIARSLKENLKVPVKATCDDSEIWLHADSYALTLAVLAMCEQACTARQIADITMCAHEAGDFVHLDVTWAGTAISADELRAWDDSPINPAVSHETTTVREVLERHGGDLWSLGANDQGRSGLRIALRGTEAPEPLHLVDSDAAERDSRPEFYDFDLFGHIGNAPQFEDRPLDELVYTVFDTETTGLDTSSDQIISIGGLRVVNGRPLQNEVFEQLIDPGRPISRESVAVHGISEDMVRGKPDLTVVLPEFHRFAEDTVLVGHNVAFDMSILQRVQDEAGVSFDAPVLDTLLLSAVVYPERGEHSLEKIAERFNIPVVGRHTAVGDAIVTAQVFLHLVKLLQDQGINTLGEALKAAQQTYLARVKY